MKPGEIYQIKGRPRKSVYIGRETEIDKKGREVFVERTDDPEFINSIEYRRGTLKRRKEVIIPSEDPLNESRHTIGYCEHANMADIILKDRGL